MSEGSVTKIPVTGGSQTEAGIDPKEHCGTAGFGYGGFGVGSGSGRWWWILWRTVQGTIQVEVVAQDM